MQKVKLMLDNMVDIHCHILPGIDDGPKTYDESLKMVEQAVNQGIKTIIATPHYPYGDYQYEKEEVFEKVETLQEKIDEAGLTCCIYPGMELYLFPGIIKKIDQNKVIPLLQKSKYLLVEFPLDSFSRSLINILHEINIRGYTPIIAHPERYNFMQHNSLVINEILQYNILMQINADSILGNNGQKAKKIAIELIKQNLVSFIASDGHSSKWRNVKLSEAIAVLEKNIKFNLLEKIINNSRKVINEQEIDRSINKYEFGKQSIFGFFKKAIGIK